MLKSKKILLLPFFAVSALLLLAATGTLYKGKFVDGGFVPAFIGHGGGLTNVPGASLAATNTTAWSGPTNTITLSYPWTDYTMYSVTSWVSITSASAPAGSSLSDSRFRASMHFTNATTSNCLIQLPSDWKRFGTALATNAPTITNGGSMLKIDIEGGATPNAVGAFSQ
jgi:hypothetical protein